MGIFSDYDNITLDDIREAIRLERLSTAGTIEALARFHQSRGLSSDLALQQWLIFAGNVKDFGVSQPPEKPKG